MPDARVDTILRTAIRQKRLVKLTYQGKPRVLEPHDYGVQNGTVKLLAYQLAGISRGPLPNWRLMEVDGITGIEMLDRTFRGGRPGSSAKHNTWDDLYLRVNPSDDNNNDNDNDHNHNHDEDEDEDEDEGKDENE